MRPLSHACLLLAGGCLAGASSLAEQDVRIAAVGRTLTGREEQILDLQKQLDKQQALIQQLLDGAGRGGAARGADAAVAAPPRGLTAAVDYGRAIDDLSASLDHSWLILCGASVMLMQAGFAMLECGSCRVESAQFILVKNLSDLCVSTIVWFFTGWAFSFGPTLGLQRAQPGSGVLGFSGFASTGFAHTAADGQIIPSEGNLHLLWFFQWAFCTTATTIVSGGVAERMSIPGYVIYSMTLSGFLYPVVVSWSWGRGWLSTINDAGFTDFAGSGVVHLTGGVGALVGAIIAGPRLGRWDNPDDFAPHSLPHIVLGTYLLWFGWYGFNCGSTLSMHNVATARLAAQIAMNTTLSATTSGIVVLIIRYQRFRKYDLVGMSNGILSGLVSIAAPCGNVDTGIAVLIGLVSAFVYECSSHGLRKLKIDDPVDASSIHGACGVWGVLAAAIFDWGRGFSQFHGRRGWNCVEDSEGRCASGVWPQAFAANMLELVCITAWIGGMSAVVFLLLKRANILRVSVEIEQVGADLRIAQQSHAYRLKQRAPLPTVFEDQAAAGVDDVTLVTPVHPIHRRSSSRSNSKHEPRRERERDAPSEQSGSTQDVAEGASRQSSFHSNDSGSSGIIDRLNSAEDPRKIYSTLCQPEISPFH